MKRGLNLLLIFGLLISLFPFTAQAATGINQHSKLLPVKESDATKSEVTYTIEIPKDAAEIDLSSIKLEKGLTLVGKPVVNMSKRELTFTVKGLEEITPSYKVAGLFNSDGRLFRANPGNAACRYSDGVKWQINTRRSTDLKSIFNDYYSTTKDKFPTDPPVSIMRDVITNSIRELSVNSTYFFKYELDHDRKPVIEGNAIDRSLINPSSLQVPKGAAFPYETTTKSKEIVYPKDYDPKKPNIGIKYLMDSDYFGEMYPRTIPNSSFLTGQAGCWMYPAYYEYYMTADTIPSTAYKYWGNITFDYIIYGEATLVGTLTADPNSIQYNNSDITIDLIVEGEVVNIEDPGALKEYLLYVRLEDGTMISDPKGDTITANGKATIKKTYQYTISQSRLSSANVKELTQQFAARIQGSYKPSSYYTGTLDSGLLNASTYVYKEAPVPPPPPEEDRVRPVAIINGMSEIKLGDETAFDGYESYDLDGYIESYRWVMPGARNPDVEENIYDPTYSNASAWYDTLGPQRVLMYVKDNDGLQNGTYHSFVVVEPTVEANISQTGTLKENRKVTFTEQSDSPSRYPVIAAKTTWKIESFMGNIPASAIKVDGSLTGNDSIDVLFKRPGEYRVTLSVENTAGYTDTVSKIYNIKPDEVPEVDFTFQEKIYRDPILGNQATFELRDQSYSTDGDQIVIRKWYVVYDANNNGEFNETKVLFNNGNNTEVEYKTTKVGRYAFYLEVQEEFGQPTIEKFVTAADRKKSNTWE